MPPAIEISQPEDAVQFCHPAALHEGTTAVNRWHYAIRAQAFAMSWFSRILDTHPVPHASLLERCKRERKLPLPQ